MSMLSAFSNQIVKFFEELSEVIPEEKDIKMATEAIKGAKKINPRLILDLFYEHIYIDLNDAINGRDQPFIVEYGRKKIATQFNEIMPAITIFDRHWTTLSVSTQDAIWKYLKVLCILCEKVKAEKK
uniref:Uncharacterized protein n=1 Tax=viral metagenome TaxID=1070528 RepID=A0A6C0DGK7_9ZZZZ